MKTVNYLLLFIGRSDKGGHEATVHSFEGLLAARRAMMATLDSFMPEEAQASQT